MSKHYLDSEPYASPKRHRQEAGDAEMKDVSGNKMVLGYWKIRGLAAPIRLVLEYTHTPYENKYYEVGPAPEYDRSSWLGEKFKLGLTFPNLPYLIDPHTNLKLTQSNAIMLYLGQRYHLAGDNAAETAIVNMILGHVYDLRDQVSRLAYNSKYDDIKAEFFSGSMKTNITDIEAVLADGRKWSAGHKLSIADFVMYEVMSICREMNPEALAGAPKIQEHLTRFEALPAIAAYLKSDRYFAHPINNGMASFK